MCAKRAKRYVYVNLLHEREKGNVAIELWIVSVNANVGVAQNVIK